MPRPTKPHTGTEKREYPRLDIRLPVTLRYGGRLIPATALNVSCGGMLLATPGGEVTANANVEVIFDLSEIERDVTLRGEIVRIGRGVEDRVGMRFTNLFALGHRTLSRHLRRRTVQ